MINFGIVWLDCSINDQSFDVFKPIETLLRSNNIEFETGIFTTELHFNENDETVYVEFYIEPSITYCVVFKEA